MIFPPVSVVIPCYNRARYVRETVDSVLAQTYSPLEVIAVDDGSTDETLTILRSYGSRITVIAQANAGVAAARNAGIRQAQGDWIALLDSDDAWLPEKIASQMSAARRWPEAALIHTLCETMDADSRQLPPGSLAEIGEDRLETEALERLMGHCYPTTSTVLIRREALLECGLFDAEFERTGGFAAEDWELYLRLAERHPFARVSRPLARYRVHSDSKTLADRLPHTRGLIALRETIDARQERWRAERGPAMAAALELHRHGYAHVYSRLGLLYQGLGCPRAAREAFAAAISLEPNRLKHRVRWGRMVLAAAMTPQEREAQACRS